MKNSKNRIAVSIFGTISVMILTGCSSGPSNKDIENSLQDQMNQVGDLAGSFLGEPAANASKTDVRVKNTSCEKIDKKRFNCTFTVTTLNDLLGAQTNDISGAFIQRDGRWVISHNF